VTGTRFPAVRTASRLPCRSAVLDWLRRHLPGTSLARAYATILVAVVVSARLLPEGSAHRLVSDSSTNLVNLRERPVYVLVVSAFVVSSAWGLWILPVLFVVYGAAQRWLGAAATAVVAVLGHVGATLFVAVLLGAGITHGQLDRSVARADDVGVSYGLAAVAGLLAARVPARRRGWYVLALLACCVLPAVPGPDFTDLGHLVAVTIGLSVAVVAVRAERAAG
jgi:hypothetical protein